MNDVITMSDGTELSFGKRRRLIISTNTTNLDGNLTVKANINSKSGAIHTIILDQETNPEMIERLIAHGLKQKLGDGVNTADTYEETDTAIEAGINNLLNGKWISRTVGSGIKGLDLVHAALCRLKDVTDDEGKATLKTKLVTLEANDKDAYKAISKNIKVVNMMKIISAEQAVARASSASDNADVEVPEI